MTLDKRRRGSFHWCMRLVWGDASTKQAGSAERPPRGYPRSDVEAEPEPGYESLDVSTVEWMIILANILLEYRNA